jgi:Ca2+/Na+ antiporter
MLELAIAIDYSSGLPLIVCAGIAMYIASKALADAITGGDNSSSGWLAIGQWIPIAVLAVAAVVTNRQEMAVGLIFSSSIACLSLALGSVAFLGMAPPIPAVSRRAWGMLAPASLLGFLAGIRGSISLFSAAVLAIQGLCVLVLWNDRSASANGSNPLPSLPPLPVTRPGRGFGLRSAQFLLALLIAGVGAWLAMHGIDKVAANSEFASKGLLTATLLSPLLVLPIIGTGTELAHRNQSAVAIGSHIGIALLNITALLPLVVLASFIHQVAANSFPLASHLPITSRLLMTERLLMTRDFWIRFSFEPVPFSHSVWRVDMMVLVILGLFVLPVGLGRWSISKSHGLTLMCAYLLYLAMWIMVQTYNLYGVH